MRGFRTPIHCAPISPSPNYTPSPAGSAAGRDGSRRRAGRSGLADSPHDHAEAVGRLFGLLHAHGVRTALDTCGEVPFEAFERVLPDTDLVLFDIKGMDPVPGKLSNEAITKIVRENFDLRPAGIIKMLDLRRPIYKQTAAYGHFGRTDVNLPWEKTDKVEALKKYL